MSMSKGFECQRIAQLKVSALDHEQALISHPAQLASHRGPRYLEMVGQLLASKRTGNSPRRVGLPDQEKGQPGAKPSSSE